MIRAIVAACVAVIVIGARAEAQTNNPTYQRRAAPRSFGYSPRFAPQFVAPSVQGFSFQRPYPYHLDYYRKRYQGGYEPYFGNLYGPPAVVGTQPFGFSPYPNQPQAGAPQQGFAPPPYARPTIACPHCQQPVPLPAPPEAFAAPPAVD